MTKADLRKAALAARATAHHARVPDAARHLARVLAPHADQPLAGYVPIRSEIDPTPAMAVHAGPLALPVVVAAGQPLAFRSWRPGEALVPGAFCAPVPASGVPVAPVVLIVPLVAFDRSGGRLGYGGGFYDRTLADLRAAGPVRAIGFAYAAQEVARVPVEPTDQPLDLIVTERGVIRPAPLAPGPGAA